METHFEGLQQARGVIARERVLQDLRILARDAQDLLKATAGDMSDRSKEIRTRLGHTLERATATCKELQGQTVEASKAAAKQADVVIRDHPYESIGVAFGLGLLIGFLVAHE
jgi:ElaB/YqjD/DUF883 family membrane-anchored ribosome-binding protein